MGIGSLSPGPVHALLVDKLWGVFLWTCLLHESGIGVVQTGSISKSGVRVLCL